MSLTAGLAAIGIGGSLIGASEQAQSAQITGQAQATMYGYQSSIATENARLARINEAYARNTGEQQAATVGAQVRGQIGQTIAAQGASGLSVNSGSAKDVVSSERDIGNIEQTTARSSAAMTAFNYEVQSKEDTAQAQMYTSAQGYAEEGAQIGVDTSAISGVTSVASKWLQASQSGAFSGLSVPSTGVPNGSWSLG